MEGPLDRRQIAQLKSVLKSDALREIVGGFQRDAEDRIALLESAVVAGDIPALRQQAHAIAGLAGNVGAARVARLAREINGLIETEDANAVSLLRAETQLACDALRAWVEES